MSSINDFVIENSILKKYIGKDSIVKIPDGVTSVGNSAFESCLDLIIIIIPDSVTRIEFGAFKNCEGLSIISIGNGITNIGAQVFKGTSNLERIYYKGSKTEWNKIAVENSSFERNVTIYYNSSYLEEEVKKLLFSEGKAEKEIYTILKKNSDISTNAVLEAFSTVKPDSKMLSSFCDRVIVPNILSILKKNKGISNYNIGEVADMLYEKYPKNLVNKAIVSVLENQYLVD